MDERAPDGTAGLTVTCGCRSVHEGLKLGHHRGNAGVRRPAFHRALGCHRGSLRSGADADRTLGADHVPPVAAGSARGDPGGADWHRTRMGTLGWAAPVIGRRSVRVKRLASYADLMGPLSRAYTDAAHTPKALLQPTSSVILPRSCCEGTSFAMTSCCARTNRAVVRPRIRRRTTRMRTRVPEETNARATVRPPRPCPLGTSDEEVLAARGPEAIRSAGEVAISETRT